MQTADWALLVSLFSLVVSLAGFLWNVWSKFIYPKPKLRVSCAMMKIFDGTPDEDEPLLNRRCGLFVTNHGPIKSTIRSVHFWDRTLLRSLARTAYVNPMPNPYDVYAQGTGPFAGGLPKTLEVGEDFAFYFPPNWHSFLEANPQFFGVIDSFGRLHSASQKDIRTLRERVRDFIQDHPEVAPIDVSPDEIKK